MEPLTPEKIKSVLVAHEEEIAALKENTDNIEKSLISPEEGQTYIEKRK